MPLMLVTASVDRIVLKKPISVDKDLKISGSIIWVGRSSIEIQMEVITQGNVIRKINRIQFESLRSKAIIFKYTFLCLNIT